MCCQSGFNRTVADVDTRLSLLSVNVNGVYYFHMAGRDAYLRASDKVEYEFSSNGFTTKCVFDQTNLNQYSAKLSIGTTCFVMVLLLVRDDDSVGPVGHVLLLLTLFGS